ncbi:carboxypeptidase-like regulatory domain-containing protein [Bordetella petrii]|uniref:carboxypeptidase-like regulatory domain-containing protein n=1 Tax=Bordetella petrii TaxID=94624 RepID=UPI001E2A24CC|nr:carboxypeptidase-like regulatory domain-containing protein [Bordetella petrii]MCD0506011.1 carboxypeptidase regulatory-like domain-containing protein [Bordetella petrii]
MNKRHERSRMATALAACTLALAVGTVAAQTTSALPPVQQQGQVQYISGGFGQDESEAMKAASSSYPLVLTFAAKEGGAYLADVHVTITDAQGQAVLDTTAKGPYLLVKLAAGQYKISASLKGNEQTRQVQVSDQGTRREMFTWST